MRTFSKALRRDATDAEKTLWGILRDGRLDGFKFRRQVPIGNYIVDFFCPSARLIVELDGSQHADSVSDLRRDRWLKAQGYQILRVWNNELTTNRDGVLTAIFAAAASASPPHPGAARHPSPSKGRGEDKETSDERF